MTNQVFSNFLGEKFPFDLRFVSEIAYCPYIGTVHIIIIVFFEIGTQMIFDKPISLSQYLRPF